MGTRVTASARSISGEHLFFIFFYVTLSCLPPSSLAQAVGHGYRLRSVNIDPAGKSLFAELKLIKSSLAYGPDVEHLKLAATFETNDRLRIRITDSDRQRWEVPQQIIPRPPPPSLAANNQSLLTTHVLSTSTSDLTVTLRSSPFGFTVSRRSTGDILFDTLTAPGPNIIFKDRYLQLSTSLPSGQSSLYGLGEHTKPTFRLAHNQTLTLWTADIPSMNPDVNLYGSHPFYMDLRSSNRTSGTAHGVLLLNSNGMDIEYSGNYLTYKVIGGILDFYFFAGPSPLAVVDQYTQLIGRPAPMPYWSFG